MPRTAIAYVRVSSTRGRVDTLQSPERQRDAIDRWCKRNDIVVVDEFRDLNRSGGTTLTRKGLEDALGMVPSVADGIVCAYAKRASRNTLDALQMIRKLDDVGGFIAAADGSIDTTTPNATQQTTSNFAQAQRELDDLRLIMGQVHQHQILEERRHMGPAPYGYFRGPDKRLRVAPAQANVVRSIFEMRADGVGWSAIARDLDARGVRDAQGRRLTPARIRTIVKRRTYLGIAFHGSNVATDAHPAIVDEVLFEAANRAVPSTSSPRDRSKRKTPEILLSGLVRCAGCRYGMKTSRQRSGRIAWACRTFPADRTAAHDCAAPARVSANEDQTLNELVIAEAKAILATVYAETADDHAAEDAERAVAQADALLDELGSLDVRESLGPERWKKLLAEARDRRAEALATLHNVQRPKAAERRWMVDEFDAMDFDEQRAVLRAVLKAVMVVAGDGPLADRVHVLPIDDTAILPRQGVRGVPLPWRP